MPFCPICRYEYVEGIKTCPDCSTELVAELPAVQESPRDEEPPSLVTVATFNYPVKAELAKLRLESEGITSYLANEILARLDGPVLQYYPVKVQVREEDAETALRILSESE